MALAVAPEIAAAVLAEHALKAAPSIVGSVVGAPVGAIFGKKAGRTVKKAIRGIGHAFGFAEGGYVPGTVSPSPGGPIRVPLRPVAAQPVAFQYGGRVAPPGYRMNGRHKKYRR
jgi:hypothetical protein